MKVKIKLLNDKAKLPVRAYDSDACYDVIATSVSFDEEEQLVSYGLGFATEIPVGYKGIIVPRSSFTRTEWVMQNSPAQMDCAYRGEWIVKFRNTSYSSEPPFQEGDRIAQIYFDVVVKSDLEEVSELNDTDRGTGGFGSTGK